MRDDSSASAPRRRLSGVARVAILIVVLVAVAEAGMRLADAQLETPLRWHEWEAQVKAGQIEMLADRGGAPIVAVGTSTMHFAFDPVQMRTELPGAPLAYNAALPGGIPRIMEIWTDLFVLPELRPKVLVVGVNSTDLNDGGTQGYFYEVFADSPEVRRLTGNSNFLEAIDHRLSTWSAFWRFRTLIRKPVTFYNSVRGHRPLNPGDAIKPLGVDVSRRTRIVDASQAKVQGFIERRQRTWLRNFTVGGAEAHALRTLVQGARDRGITVVIVEMPIGDYYVRAHPQGGDDYAKFKQAIATLVADTGSIFLDASRSVAPTPDFFADFVHLNGKGAKAFTTYLGRALRERGLA
ncbi:MAG: hypothetical protein ACRDKS_17805 [Actinomycetota bacterium]